MPEIAGVESIGILNSDLPVVLGPERWACPGGGLSRDWLHTKYVT